MRRCYGLHWTLHHCPLSQALLLWCHNVMAVIVPWNVRGPERETYQHPGNANSRRSWAVNRAIIFWISMQFVAYFCWITPYTCTVFNPECVFLRDSRTKNHNDPQNGNQGVKNDPLPFLWKSLVFGPHKQNNDISHDIDYQELQKFMIQTK